jgi:hypothetical protein
VSIDDIVQQTDELKEMIEQHMDKIEKVKIDIN